MMMATSMQNDGVTYPKITAFHFMMLLSHGAPLIPDGGSYQRQEKSVGEFGVETTLSGKKSGHKRTFCNFLKSRINRLRAGVDMVGARRGREEMDKNNSTWSKFYSSDS